MPSSQLVSMVLGVIALGYISVRQLQVRPAKATMRLPVLLAVIGLIQLAGFIGQHGHHPGRVFATLAGSLLVAVLFAGARAATVQVWVDGGRAWRQGSMLTVLLWIASLGVHLGYDYVVDGSEEAGLGAASLLLYLAVTLTGQQMMIMARARRGAQGERLDLDGNKHIRWP